MKDQLERISEAVQRLERRCSYRRHKLNWIDPHGFTVDVEKGLDAIRVALIEIELQGTNTLTAEEQGRRMLRDLPVTALHAPRYGRRRRRTAKG